MGDVIDSAFQVVSHMAKFKNVQLVKPQITEHFAQIYGDKRRYQQVLINFLSNSLKFSERGSEIILHLKVIEM